MNFRYLIQKIRRFGLRILSIKTAKRIEMVDITGDVRTIIREEGFVDGLCHLFVPHTTAALTINENADPAVCRDILNHLSRLVPPSSPYDHREGNADAHIKSSLVGPSETLIVEGGRLVLGTWQALFFCEFDGPRERKVFVKLLPKG